ncbi:MAG TPA: transcription antitermination factor NusB [Acidobacteriaceae bacterium]|nr:transcription antitermination factor NusB [Acidobacteriaceae bacterium]
MIAPARRAAFRILLNVATTDAHSDELLRSPEVDALSAQDRNLTTTLVLGTLRWQLALDARIRPLLSRPKMKLAPETAVTLRMGAYQLLHLDRLPAHAVVNDAVELVKQGSERGAAGMVNAILRKVAAQPRWEAPARLGCPADLAAAWAHPAWMVERWALRYGLQHAEAICRWDQEPAAVTLRVDAEGDVSLPGLELQPGAFLSRARRLMGGDPSAPLRSDQARVQDEASQLVAEIAAAASSAPERVLDTCAAPGGKTAVLAERLPAAHITALDVSRRRLAEMRRIIPAPLRTAIRFKVADAATLQLKPEYSLILCDVPCSGTGTMARNPEIRLRVEAAELKRQQTRQFAIVRAALAGLAPGGRLVYSTCSLEPEENEKVVEMTLQQTSGLRLIPVADILDRLEASGVLTPAGRQLLGSATDGDFLRTIPGVHPCDGFFAAILERDQ